MSNAAVAADLPGWGRSATPTTDDFDYSMYGLADFFGRMLDALGIGEYTLVVHDWGSVALMAALQDPGRVRRLLLFNNVPLLPGYRWHWVARYFWRRRWLGELINATATRPGTELILRQATARPGPMPKPFVDELMATRRRGAWPQMLTLYRSADPGALAAAGARLGELSCPTLILWPRQDAYIPVRFASEYARRIPGAEVEEIENAGHWPWIDRPEIVDRAVEFLESS